MSAGSLSALARLSGASTVATRLYGNAWPGVFRRSGQLACSAAQWFRYGPSARVLCGKRLPAAAGEVSLKSTLGLREWMDGAFVLRDAELARLTTRLGLDDQSIGTMYLAHAGVLVVFGRRGNAPVVVHVSSDPVRLQRYRERAEQARRTFAKSGLQELVPDVLEQRPVLDLHMLVQQRAVGRNMNPVRVPVEAQELVVEAALQPLRALAAVAAPSNEAADSELIDSALPRLAEHQELGARIRGPLAALRSWPGRWSLPAVLAHGDYCLTNVLYAEHGDAPSVCAVLDWERARTAACAGFDGLYFVVFSYGHWHRRPVMNVLCDLWDGNCDPMLDRMLTRVTTTLGLTREDLKYVGVAIWLRHLHEHAPELSAWTAQRRRDWLDQPARSVHHWLASGAR